MEILLKIKSKTIILLVVKVLVNLLIQNLLSLFLLKNGLIKLKLLIKFANIISLLCSESGNL